MSQYGKVRQIDIPQEDSYRNEMEKSISGMHLNWFHGSQVSYFSFFKVRKLFFNVLVTIF